jgi:hypothetical protein
MLTQSRHPDLLGAKRLIKGTSRWSHNGDQIWTWTEDYWMKENGDIFVLSKDQNAIAYELAG